MEMNMAESATKLEDIVGEGKRYKTPEDLVKSRLEADNFITQIQTENATLRDELSKALVKAGANDTLEKLMTELANKNNVNGETKPESKPSEKGNQPQTLTQEDIVKLMEARELARVEADNLNKSMEYARKVFGDKLDESIETKAKELGLDRAQVEAIAKRSPSAFNNLLGLNQQVNSTRSMARDGHSAPATTVVKDGIRNKAYYDNLKKDMGITKFVMNRDLQVQLHKDLTRLGDAWDS
jgi:hypothetical protein